MNPNKSQTPNQTRSIMLSDITEHRNPRGQCDVSDLEESIAKVGLLHPVTVVETTPAKYKLLAGNRRLAAVQALRWPEISAVVFRHDAGAKREHLLQEVAAIHENLRRKNLPKSVQAKELAALKTAYEKLYPEAAHGCTKKKSAQGGTADRFSKVAAKSIGMSERSVQRAAKMGKNAVPGVLEALDAGMVSVAQADKLSSLPQQDQEHALARVLAPADSLGTPEVAIGMPADVVNAVKLMADAERALFARHPGTMEPTIYGDLLRQYNALGDAIERHKPVKASSPPEGATTSSKVGSDVQPKVAPVDESKATPVEQEGPKVYRVDDDGTRTLMVLPKL